MSAAPPPIANDGEGAILAEVEVDAQEMVLGDMSFEEAYEIERTLAEIEKAKYVRVALQFPDELLHDSVKVFQILRKRLPTSVELYILADTTYGSCCVDEVAAQHVDADVVIHYGHTCFTPTARLPVLYVLLKKEIDTDAAVSALSEQIKEESFDEIELFYETGYHHACGVVASKLEKATQKPVIMRTYDLDQGAPKTEKLKEDVSSIENNTTAPVDSDDAEEDVELTPADGVSDVKPASIPERFLPDQAEVTVVRPVDTASDSETRQESTVVCFIGSEGLTLSNVMITHSKSQVYSYDPETNVARLENGQNRMLMKRYAMVGKAKDADVIGILVGTLGASHYLSLIKTLRRMITDHHKKAYTIAVGKLNPAKLANFMEIECYVLVGCRENTLVDSKEFLQPIVTPFELEMALTNRAWTGDYILDIKTLLARSDFGQTDAENAGDDDPEGPVFSATTGTYRTPKRYVQGQIDDVSDLTGKANALAITNTSSAVSRVLGSAAGEFLSNRTYQGLDPRYNQDAASVVEVGRKGTARGYENEM